MGKCGFYNIKLTSQILPGDVPSYVLFTGNNVHIKFISTLQENMKPNCLYSTFCVDVMVTLVTFGAWTLNFVYY